MEMDTFMGKMLDSQFNTVETIPAFVKRLTEMPRADRPAPTLVGKMGEMLQPENIPQFVPGIMCQP